MIFWKHSIRNYMLIPFMVLVKLPIAMLGVLLLNIGKAGKYILNTVIPALPYFEQHEGKYRDYYRKEKERFKQSFNSQVQSGKRGGKDASS